MKRQELEELGLTKEQVDAVMRINGADIENAKSIASSTKASEYEALKEQVGAADELRKQIAILQEQNKASEDAPSVPRAFLALVSTLNAGRKKVPSIKSRHKSSSE